MLRPALQDILEKALAKNPEERYQSAADFALDLRRLKKAQPLQPAIRDSIETPGNDRNVGTLLA